MVYVKFYTQYGVASEVVSAKIMLLDSRLRGNDNGESVGGKENNYFVYNQPRLKSLSQEQNKAKELKQELEKHYGKSKIPIHKKHWHTIVNAYIYGNYPILSITQAIKFGGKTVHPSIPFFAWKNAGDYLEWIGR